MNTLTSDDVGMRKSPSSHTHTTSQGRCKERTGKPTSNRPPAGTGAPSYTHCCAHYFDAAEKAEGCKKPCLTLIILSVYKFLQLKYETFHHRQHSPSSLRIRPITAGRKGRGSRRRMLKEGEGCMNQISGFADSETVCMGKDFISAWAGRIKAITEG